MSMTEQEIRIKYGKLINAWRLRNHLGLREVSKIIDISSKTLGRIEMGYTKDEEKAEFRGLISRLTNNK